MAENKQKKNQRISKDQKQKLVDYMSTNLEFARGQFGGPNANIKNKGDWETLSASLNSMGGSTKTIEQWKKCWIDLKSAVKKQINSKRHFLNKTGGGSGKDAPRDLDPFEEQILAIMGTDAVDGDGATPESGLPLVQEEFLSVEILEDSSDVAPSPAKKVKRENVKATSFKSALEEARNMHDDLLTRISQIEHQNSEILKKMDVLINAFGLSCN